MNIELIYDPVGPQTTVCIDGQVTDGRDIYGFLYPVRRCLLQTWLKKTGSWSGLAAQLRELARGEGIELTFRGREADFRDVEAALRGVEKLRLHFRQEEPAAGYDGLFADLEQPLGLLMDETRDPGNKKTFRDLFPEEAEQLRMLRHTQPDPWLRWIRTEEELLEADQAELCCCAVGEEYLDSYEKLEALRLLTRSMRRSQDMIVCCVADPVRQQEFVHFAAQYPDLDLRFQSQQELLPLLEEKYGKAFLYRQKLDTYRQILAVLARCFGQREAVSAKKLSLAKLSDPSEEELDALDQCKCLLNWFDRKHSYYETMTRRMARGHADAGKEA